MSNPAPGSAYASVTEDDILTGEAVAIDLPAAGIGARMVAGILDLALYLFVALSCAMFVLWTVPADLQAPALIASMVFSIVVLPATVETLSRGRSLGKLTMGLRTVRDDAGPISFQHAFVRALIAVVEIIAFQAVPALFSAVLSRRGKRIGDHAAGTYVVKVRVPLLLHQPIQMPPQLAHWARTADIAALPPDLALASRRLLTRSASISPRSFDALGQRLAEQTSNFVHPLPPPGTPPGAFLAAVLAARRDRDLERLHRERETRNRLLHQLGP